MALVRTEVPGHAACLVVGLGDLEDPAGLEGALGESS